MAIEFLPKKENESNRDYVFRVLRYNIMSLQLPPGSILNEYELAQEFSMSRTPVHEVLMLLKNQDLVSIAPQSRTAVTLIDLSAAREGYFLRRKIEPYVLQQLSFYTSPTDMQRLLENLKQQEALVAAGGSFDAFAALDSEFHQIMYSAANKPHIWSAIQSCSAHFDRIRYLNASMTDESNITLPYQQHRDMFFTLSLGTEQDFSVIDRRVEEHFLSIKDNFVAILENNRSYFTENINASDLRPLK